MVYVFGRIHAELIPDCSRLPDLVLCIPDVYAEARAGAEAGSMAYYTGECDWIDGVYPVSLYYEAAGFFQADDFCVFWH